MTSHLNLIRATALLRLAAHIHEQIASLYSTEPTLPYTDALSDLTQQCAETHMKLSRELARSENLLTDELAR